MSRPVKLYWKIFLICFASFVLFLALLNLGVFGKMPSLVQLENPSIMLATEVYGDDGTADGKILQGQGKPAAM